MNIQSMLVAYTKGTIDTCLPGMSAKAIKSTISRLDSQLKLVEMCKNPAAIPHADKMKALKTILTTELNRRGVS